MAPYRRTLPEAIAYVVGQLTMLAVLCVVLLALGAVAKWLWCYLANL